MKNIVISPRRLPLFLGGWLSSICLAGSALASPGGGGVAAGGTGSVAAGGSAASGGAAAGGGSHGGSQAGGQVGSTSTGGGSFGGGHAAAVNGAGERTGPGSTGVRSGGLVPTGFPSRGTGVAYANEPAGFTRPASPANPNVARLPNNNVAAPANNGAGFTMSRSFDGGPRTGELRVSRSPSTGRMTPQIRNAWTEPNNPHVAPAARVLRNGDNNAYDEDRSALRNRVLAGQHVYPGAAGYSTVNPGRTDGGRQNNGYRNSRGAYGDPRTRDAYNRFYFTSLFYPYLYNNFFPLYGGYFGGGYGFGDDANVNSSALDDPAYNTPITGNVTNTYNNPDGNDGGADQNNRPQSAPSADDSLPPNQPSSVGPQNPTATRERASTETGPDTLVESVQSELAKRGYFGGKVDSMYNDATRAALKRFQGDQQLAVTGRINEATLHALQLD